MSPSSEASALLRELAQPAPAGAHIDVLIRKAARRVGFSFGRARSLWYELARRIDSDEMDALRRAVADQLGAEIELRTRCEQLTKEIEFLRARLAEESAQRRL